MDKSNNMTIENIEAVNLQKFLFKIDETIVNSIKNLSISDSLNTIEFYRSKISMMSQSIFNNNGAGTKLKGGALNFINCEVNIQNSTFIGNKAEQGGAISFE